jgi:hypothetical protein
VGAVGVRGDASGQADRADPFQLHRSQLIMGADIDPRPADSDPDPVALRIAVAVALAVAFVVALVLVGEGWWVSPND